MNNGTQINIISDKYSLPYYVECSKPILSSSSGYYYNVVDQYVYMINNKYNNMIRKSSIFSSIFKEQSGPFYNTHIPHNNMYVMDCNVYIPRQNVDLYTDTEYSLSVYIYIAGTYVVLANYRFSINDIVAAPKPLKYKNITYYDYISFRMADPWHVIFDDSWQEFRSEECGERPNTNSDGSQMSICITPIVKSSEGCWMETPGFIGGISALHLMTDTPDDLKLSLSYDGAFNSVISFNSSYEQNIKTYLNETYNINIPDNDKNITILYNYFVKDKENIYKDIIQTKTYPNQLIQDLNNSSITKYEVGFEDWSEYLPGMFMIVSANIYIYQGDWDDSYIDTIEPIMTLISNQIPITSELFKFLLPVVLGDQIIDKINITNVDMNIYNVNIANKLINNIVKVDKPDDAKSNIIQPVFISSQTSTDINIHPAVTENIKINLNKYKADVKLFKIKIEGVEFLELNRIETGVIFKIKGSLLPNKIQEGIYYIINDDNELVTTGKYKYIQ